VDGAASVSGGGFCEPMRGGWCAEPLEVEALRS
jgi:hypothetical protein